MESFKRSLSLESVQLRCSCSWGLSVQPLDPSEAPGHMHSLGDAGWSVYDVSQLQRAHPSAAGHVSHRANQVSGQACTAEHH